MGRTGLFKLIDRLVADHDRRSDDGPVLIVPVIIDELEAALPTLEAATRYAGGTVLHPDSKDLVGPVPGTPPAALRAAIEDRLSVTRPVNEVSPLAIQETPDGRWDVTVSGEHAAEAGEADAMLIALAKALIHRDLVRSDIAVVAYSETPLDLRARPAAWDLVTEGLVDPQIDFGSLRTLVAAVGAPVDVGRHCHRGRAGRGGLAYALDQGTIRARNPVSDLPAQVRRMVESPRLILHLGAGFSNSSRLPLGNELRDESMQRQLNTTAQGEALARRYFGWAHQTGRFDGTPEGALTEDEFVEQVTLENVVRVEALAGGSEVPRTLTDFKERHDACLETPGAAVLAFERILAAPGRIALVTVNFDELLEHRFADLVQRFVTDDEFEACPEYLREYFAGNESKVPLLKLHGTISRFDTCLVSDEAIRQGLPQGKRSALASLLLADTRTSWTYVGASLRDDDIAPVLSAPPFTPECLEERWVMPYPDEAIERFVAHRKPRWRALGRESMRARWVTEFADDFMQELASQWS